MGHFGLGESKEVGCDTETTGLAIFGQDRPFAFSFTSEAGVNAYLRFEVDPFTREVLYNKDEGSTNAFAALKAFYEDASIAKVFHNANFDILMLKQIGIKVAGRVFDTQIMAHVYNPSLLSYQLKPLSWQLLKYPMDDQKDLQASVVVARREGKKAGWKLAEDVEADYFLGDPALCEKYAVGDTERTMKLYQFYGEWYYGNAQHPRNVDYCNTVDMEMDLLEIARRMMDRGHQVDLSVIGELKTAYGDEIIVQEAKKAVLGYGDLNQKSTQQMHKVFYEKMGLPAAMRTRKKKSEVTDAETGETKIVFSRDKTPSVDSEALAKWAHEGNELAGCLVEIGACRHQLSSFIEPFEANSYPDAEGNRILHPSYKTLGATTGRMSCVKPNLMNIPDSKSGKRRSNTDYRARECFIPRKGHVLYYPDYSQIEVWVAAFMSRDKIFMQQLLDGADIHAINAEKFWGGREDFQENKSKYRKKAKTVTFGSLYGAGKDAISQQAEVPAEEAERIHHIFWDTYCGLRDFGYGLQRQIKRQGWIKNPFGRRYVVHPDVAYKAMNYMVQGSSCEVLKRAIIAMDKTYALRWNGSHILMAIHDEVVSEIPVRYHGQAIMKDVVSAMQGNYHEVFGIPHKLKVGMSFTTTNWSEKEEVQLPEEAPVAPMTAKQIEEEFNSIRRMVV